MNAQTGSYEQITYAVDQAVATITLNRPDKLNAFTPVMARELVEAFSTADADDDVRVVILTGAGRAFCAGADLAAGSSTFDYDNARRSGGFGERGGFGEIDGAPRDSGGVVALRIAGMLKPVIVAVNGPAVGVGATMTLPADIRLAGESAKFGFVFTRRGLVPEAASSWFLPRVVGISQAMDWVATGRVFGAAEAREGRLVSRVLPDDELLPAAVETARQIVANTSGVAVAAARQMLWGMLGAGSPWTAHRVDSKAIHVLGAQSDVAEGVASFLEKRPPKFPLRVSESYPDFIPPWPAH